MNLVLIHGKYFNSWEALGLGYIGAYVKAHVPAATVSFFQGCFDDDDTMVRGCAGADVVAFSCTTPTFPHTLKLARRIKSVNPQVRIVVGGYHPSAASDASLVDGIDQVVVGEGEAALVEILNGNRDRVVHGRTMDFTELPWPDRHLIKNERNIGVAYKDNKKRITSFQSHRACPFMCKYCLDGFNKVLYGNVRKAPMRYRPVDDLVDEIVHVTNEFRLDLIKFSDPTWNTDMGWVMDFCEEKIRRSVTVPFYPNIHATITSQAMFDAMAAAGCYEIAIGIESGSPKILKQIGKGTTVETIKRCVKWAQTAGIKCRGYFILGMPEETHDDLLMTQQLADDLALDEYGFTILCPYPGTQMYSAERFKDVDWALADEYSNDFWRGQYLSNQELKDWQTRLTSRYKNKLTWHNKAVGHG